MRKATNRLGSKKALRKVSDRINKRKQTTPKPKLKQDNSQLKAILRQFYRIQEHRIAFGAQIRALEEDKQDTTQLEMYYMRLQDLEKEMEKYLKEYVKGEKLW